MLVGRRKVVPWCSAILGVWTLITFYLFVGTGPFPNKHSLLSGDEPIPNEFRQTSRKNSLGINNDFNVDEYKKVENGFDDNKVADDSVMKEYDVKKNDDEMKEEEVDEDDRLEQDGNVMPVAIVPIDEREAIVDLDKLAMLDSPEEKLVDICPLYNCVIVLRRYEQLIDDFEYPAASVGLDLITCHHRLILWLDPSTFLAHVTKNETEQKKILFEKYQFNGLLSDRIGYRRKIPDTRNSHTLSDQTTSSDRRSPLFAEWGSRRDY
ncbi:unnamed protein product [Angiostrongylus costaricensis]|uniref:Alpha--mannosyltransferase n=1 Tax=Angiostrongylus costaricensis TaxID=334426 RepID=A0A0R3PKY4_ANGCS|nr:unnamed protein product [Angiostrongylus costaricensis]